MSTRPMRSGAALIEALVALAIFGTAAVGWMALARQSERAVDAYSAHDRQMREADAALAFAAAAPRDSLAAYAVGRRFASVVAYSRELGEGLVRLHVERADGSALLATVVFPEQGAE